MERGTYGKGVGGGTGIERKHIRQPVSELAFVGGGSIECVCPSGPLNACLSYVLDEVSSLVPT